MTRPDEARLLDILLSARKAREYVEGVERARFDSDTLLQDGVVRRLEVIGEAAAAVTPATRQTHPIIAWHRMIGMRNRLAHEYFRVDLDIVWHVVMNEIPALISALEPLVPPEEDV